MTTVTLLHMGAESYKEIKFGMFCSKSDVVCCSLLKMERSIVLLCILEIKHYYAVILYQLNVIRISIGIAMY